MWQIHKILLGVLDIAGVQGHVLGSASSAGSTSLERRVEALPHSCPLVWILPIGVGQSVWVGRFCDRNKQKNIRRWLDLCYTGPGHGAFWLPGDTHEQTLRNGLAPAMGYKPHEIEIGLFNAARLPRQRSSRITAFGWCPNDYECAEFVDGDLDSHMYCIRNVGGLHEPGKPDFLRYSGVGENPYTAIELFHPGLLQPVVEETNRVNSAHASTSTALVTPQASSSSH